MREHVKWCAVCPMRLFFIFKWLLVLPVWWDELSEMLSYRGVAEERKYCFVSQIVRCISN